MVEIFNGSFFRIKKRFMLRMQCELNIPFRSVKLKMSDVLKIWWKSFLKSLIGISLSVSTKISVRSDYSSMHISYPERMVLLYEGIVINMENRSVVVFLLCGRWDPLLMIWNLRWSTLELHIFIIVILREINVEHTRTCKIWKICETWGIARCFTRFFLYEIDTRVFHRSI